jgi:hypothetical protein
MRETFMVPFVSSKPSKQRDQRTQLLRRIEVVPYVELSVAAPAGGSTVPGTAPGTGGLLEGTPDCVVNDHTGPMVAPVVDPSVVTVVTRQ